ncbi:MAG: hypothetical protein Q8N30_11315 [Methylococcales bacterium]|nr:hypothetical protein [Methylococcales bacterium]
MLDTVKRYLRLCWFDTNPLDFVESTDFLKINVVFFAVVQYFLQANMTDDPFESFFEVAFELLLTFGFVAVMLFFDKMLDAFIQLITAILFCTNVLSVFFVPIMVWVTVTDDPLSYYVMVVLVLWFYALITHIIKAALAIDLLASLALSLLYFIVVYIGAVGLGQVI